MSAEPTVATVAKDLTHIPGLDEITDGGLPRGRVTLVAGTSGSGKTVLACQFISAGVAAGTPGVIVTFEERPEDLVQNMRGLGIDLAGARDAGTLTFVNAALSEDEETVVSGDYDLAALIARIGHAVTTTGATRVVIDSVSALMARHHSIADIRHELVRLVLALKSLGVTALITSERTADYGEQSYGGIEQYVVDNVVVLRNALDDERRRRTIEVVKLRGAPHRRGEYPLSIVSGRGIVADPLATAELRQQSTTARTSSGIPELDTMCRGGFFRDSVMLVSGATGTGKTLLVSQFLSGGTGEDDRTLLFAYEESRSQLIRNARGWGIDLEALEAAGKLRIHCQYPESAGSEEHLVAIKAAIDEYQPTRMAIDSLSAMERVAPVRAFREFVLSITAYAKEKDVTTLLTSTTDQLVGATSVTDSHISTVTDGIILLRYLESAGEILRSIAVLKLRGSAHDRAIRAFTIDGGGMQIGETLHDHSGILAGTQKRE
jgi:circadian clock protein KaiC